MGVRVTIGTDVGAGAHGLMWAQFSDWSEGHIRIGGTCRRTVGFGLFPVAEKAVHIRLPVRTDGTRRTIMSRWQVPRGIGTGTFEDVGLRHLNLPPCRLDVGEHLLDRGPA